MYLAWGQEEKAGSQVHIRSFELSVLFLPQDFTMTEFDVQNFPLILELPLEAYGDKDEPWLSDKSYSQVDNFGKTWKT